jgi:hypothetical protein
MRNFLSELDHEEQVEEAEESEDEKCDTQDHEPLKIAPYNETHLKM